MSYVEALQFLYGLQKHGVTLGLERVAALVHRLGHPQNAYRTLHVGGTNGKGSTAAMAASVLQKAGYRVGLYTSPHLIAFNERIRVDGEPIPDPKIIELTERLRTTVDGQAPTFFEFTTAMAFQHFSDEQIDMAVIEVGMGGRFDATNVIKPVVSAITNVSLDHQQHLGTTIRAIAYEKAGIIKPGIPIVTGRLHRAAAEVIESVAREQGSAVFRLDDAFDICGDSKEAFTYEGLRQSWRDLFCPLPGAHQLDNAACALAMLELLDDQDRPIPESAARAGLRDVRWEGRLEVIERRPLVVLDGAHNAAAGAVVAEYLARRRCQQPRGRRVLVIGMMRDKDAKAFFSEILPVADEVVLTRAGLERAATVSELRSSLGVWEGIVHETASPTEALSLARRRASPDDVICVTGSLLLVGEVKALLRGCAVSSLHG